MRRRTETIELLSPAGNFEALVAAISGGADAVYVGGKNFGARAFAGNFDAEELRLAVEYCHLHGVKLYVTVNTLVYDREFSELLDYAVHLYKIGVDAIICADLGAIRRIKQRVPNLEIHASTQMSVHNTSGTFSAYDLGCTRVVPARELSLPDIKKIVDESPCEVEIFLHGALCVCYSGQCLFSSLVGGRSGNRGECAQPCRLPYNGEKYPLSLKDLSLAEHITEILDTGIASLKIEGRMKSAEYVYRVTSIYRRLLDEERNANSVEKKELADIFSRGGFTDGYFVGKTEKNMTGVRSERDKENTRAVVKTQFALERVSVCAEAKMKLGEPSSLTLILGEKRVTAYGSSPVAALNAPLENGAVCERLSKMGNTYLSLLPSDIKLALDEGINLSPSAINSLRREAAALMQSCEREFSEEITPCNEKTPKREYKRLRTALFFNEKSFSEAFTSSSDSFSNLDIIFLPLKGYDSHEGKTAGVYLPPIIFDSEMAEVREMLSIASARGAKYALVGNIGAISLAQEANLIPVADFRLNVSNRAAREALFELGVENIILSPELTPPMARDIGGSVITYGRIPLMITERCFMRENFGCDKCGKCSLSDRTGAAFPMMREYSHRNIIFNSAPTYMGDKKAELVKNSLYSEHFIFSTESPREIIDTLRKIDASAPLNRSVRRMGKRESK